ncbi:longiborneol synthase [Fusarium sporotrichioides]|uniref:Longiborneol synthase n=1 Tax=Fusarium sporotrichioides TaxID=5514 RepID=A0A395RYP1_FUSSP|nr:longiborneol synthase [Fusarium sporotrichioides]
MIAAPSLIKSDQPSPLLDGGDPPALAAHLQPLYTKFVADLDLKPEFKTYNSEKLLEEVLKHAEATGVPYPPNSHSYQSLMVGYAYVDNCLLYHDLEVKVFVAIYTWLATICDDAERLDIVADVEMFQQRYVHGIDQPTTLLRAFASQLQLAYDLYHPLVANLIINSSLNLLTSTALVAREGIKQKCYHPSKGGNYFPWYIRERDGVGEAYAWFTFPKTQFPNLDIPIEAIEDMTRFIAYVNDVLSFYKETLGGETNNYINTTAAYEGIDSTATLHKTSQDAVNCARRIESVLAGKGKYEEAWRLHASGYIQMHNMRGRYRVWEVGIGRKADVEELVQSN